MFNDRRMAIGPVMSDGSIEVFVLKLFCARESVVIELRISLRVPNVEMQLVVVSEI